MALVTVHAVVNVTADVWMLEIIRVPAAMTTRALEHCVVARIRVARGADSIGVAVIGREVGVIEGRTCPTGRRMADSTGVGEACSNMVRIVCLLILRLVTAITVGGQGGVVVIHVTVRARDRRVSACQRERGVVVVEGSR